MTLAEGLQAVKKAVHEGLSRARSGYGFVAMDREGKLRFASNLPPAMLRELLVELVLTIDRNRASIDASHAAAPPEAYPDDRDLS